MNSFYVDPDINLAESLPPETFISTDFLKRELGTIFKKCWIFVPQKGLEILKEKNSRAPFESLGKQLYLEMDNKGVLHCLSNVCTHKGYILVPAPKIGERVVCGQHGREFSSSGKFLRHHGFENAENFPRDCDHLKEFLAVKLNQFFFVNLGSAAAPLWDFVNEMSLDCIFNLKIGLDSMRRRILKKERRVVKGNWKQHVDNYLDNFHLTYIHSESLAKTINVASYATKLHKFSANQRVLAKNLEHGFSQENPIFASWWFIFPNMAFNFYPWGLSVNVWMPVIDKPDKTLFLWYHFVRDESAYEKRNEIWLNDQVDQEDLAAMAEVRKGFLSGINVRGRFSPKYEAASHWFHRKIYEMTKNDK